ncbi:hypothetical protein LJ656_34070 [Paraburkholderia sp. MMS20-SJTR3]|uniref:HEAT repeat domain-containing protein n=1 Tax=Paraburkholderia sejongensis TaxID=2886946 RepID=A0ABS8K619_9BURK|nr:hypothetical protein [Paraburkholderia sp. MMS20-SJTR3]MCC8397580.1 hypothetical protein [Paraburkholderia sp. MMS20-SJTR3]
MKINSLDGTKAIRAGLSARVPSDIASQNLVLFDNAVPALRARFVKVPEEIAEAIVGRKVLDLSYDGANAAGCLLWDACTANRSGFPKAAAMLLPFAMREPGRPASALIAATFPSVYRALQQERIPDVLSLMFPFMDWDRCKTARRELASGFSNSQWRPIDIAVAAARAGDSARILRVIAHSRNGRSIISAIERDIETIQPPWRKEVQVALIELSKGTGD